MMACHWSLRAGARSRYGRRFIVGIWQRSNVGSPSSSAKRKGAAISTRRPAFRVSLCNLTWLVGDDPAEARRQLTVADERWAWRGMHLQHYWSMVAWGQVDNCTKGEPPRRTPGWPAKDRVCDATCCSGSRTYGFEFDWLYARAALARAQREPRPGERCWKRQTAARGAWEGRARVGESREPAGDLWCRSPSRRWSGRDDGARRVREARRQLRADDRLAHGELVPRAFPRRRRGGADLLGGAATRPDRWAEMLAPGLSGAI